MKSWAGLGRASACPVLSTGSPLSPKPLTSFWAGMMEEEGSGSRSVTALLMGWWASIPESRAPTLGGYSPGSSVR